LSRGAFGDRCATIGHAIDSPIALSGWVRGRILSGFAQALAAIPRIFAKTTRGYAMLRCGKEYHSPLSIVLQNEILCVIPPQDARYHIDLVSMMIWTVGIVVNTCRDRATDL
jgi:hypothetical protein